MTLLDATGLVLARPDFLWEDAGLVGEFDGLAKYSEHARPGETPADVLEREKQREDLLRSLGWMVIRWTWKDLSTRDIGDRIKQQLAIVRPRPFTVCQRSA